RSVAVSDWPPIRALSIVARAVSPTRAAASTRFAAATILNPIADTGSISIENSSAWAELFARDNCEPRSKNALRHVDPHPLLRAGKYHCCRGLQPDRRRPPEGANRGRHASRRAGAAVAVHRQQISGHATEHAFDLQQLAAGAGGRKDWTVPHAIDAGDSRHDSRPLPWSSGPVGARCERCKDYRRPSAYGCRRRHAVRAEAAA